MKKVMFSLSLVAILSGCATAEKYDKNVSKWIGYNINQLVAEWGIPAKTMDMPNGGKIYQYSTNEEAVAYAQNYGYGSIASVSNQSCETTITADSYGTIRAYSWRGNCRSK